jgi:CO/xanthine dehydrogenase Mo-binding subunit
VGTVAAIALAVYDAPGKCGRDPPITLGKLILPNGQRVE